MPFVLVKSISTRRGLRIEIWERTRADTWIKVTKPSRGEQQLNNTELHGAEHRLRPGGVTSGRSVRSAPPSAAMDERQPHVPVGQRGPSGEAGKGTTIIGA